MTTKAAQLDEITYSSFKVTDSNGNPVTGLTTSDFTILLYNPSGSEVHASTTDGIRELGYGMYQYYATLTVQGIYSTKIVHSTYLPTGVAGDFEVHDDRALLKRVLGLVQENMYLDNTVYSGENLTSARLRIYSVAGSVGTDSDVLATYALTAVFGVSGTITSYKFVKS